MAKVLIGKVVSTKMQDTAVVEVSRRVPHKIYKKLLKRSKKFKVDSRGFDLAEGTRVKIVEIKPLSKEKYFKIQEVIHDKHEKKETVKEAKKA